MLKGPDGLYRHARYVSSDSTGRTYQIAIPVKTAISVQVSSTLANVFDQTGAPVQARSPVSLQPATPADLTPVSFTLHKK